MRYLLPLGLAALLMGCTDTGPIDDAIKAKLDDPNAFEIGETTVVQGKESRWACATVTMKDRDGKAVGEREAILNEMEEHGWQLIEVNGEYSHDYCVTVISHSKTMD